ncbi:glycosyltransferase family 2 protein [Bacillus spizizenii]|uniref:glycosyltransferase family 2 protein n=1 Tax=Bacillus spizizenii TaxID=96241 RepID=UPI00227FD20F|nr:glycosyltransferase family 2 protein [Bacillus spizizenii]MCY7795169.1 glycosyltransferase family 2 protein [Bacillus spizizenii]MCY7802597.1 glycosyltransferase family 2 protein [Bacillus spizizenii]MCY7896410.1 glycosyltransferase family 2 protein [Bacillus spizizenii]MCY8211078.1 glycosyltransferase family 2 protein [Bacillus spizizenii]MCY9353641.1 glycosyltransferase family 2 protein [Bacillus spizizenii]
MTRHIQYSVVVPVYNEELVIHETYQRLKEVMDQTKENYELLFVNDGSKDHSIEILREHSLLDPRVKIIDFSRNFGHQIAITAGMDYAQGNAMVVIDADLQDPPELILDMIEKWREGYEVVYAVRTKRKGETFFKKQTAALFYRLLSSMTDIDIPIDTGDFRLMDRKVCDEMKRLKEKNPFVRGLVSWVGFKQTAVEYVRDERLAGETKYPLKKMLKLSMDGITTFSHKPLKLASYAGMLMSGAGFLYMFIVLYLKLFTDSTITGWSSLILIQLLFSGIVLLILGMIGEYIGRIYDEAKDRPLYIVQKSYGIDNKRLYRDQHMS